MKTIKAGLLLLTLTAVSISQAMSQNALQILTIAPTLDGSMVVTWQGNTNEVYEIDETDSLTNSLIVWNKLADDYPSQGTNTFWMDTGNYFATPQIVHPKFSPMRFYRVVLTGTNTDGPPSVSVTSPTNTAIVSGLLTVTVSASATDSLAATDLYVDGQKMPGSPDGTNFVINTCEWANGSHILFATAKSASTPEGPPHVTGITYGHAVSAFVNVTFNNLIEQLAFSQPFFEPALGQTQQVTATFASNVNWTLSIQDVYSNDVASTSGAGTSMLYNWDGMSNGVAIPDGIYTYLVSAETNGNTPSGQSGQGGTGGGPPPPGSAGDTFNDGANSGTFTLLLPPPPPGFSYGTDENGKEITTMSVKMPNDEVRSNNKNVIVDGATPDGTSDEPAPPGNQTTQGPTRPPTNPVKGTVGTFGVVYFQFPNGLNVHEPTTGWPAPLQTHVAIDGLPAGNGTISFGSLSPSKDEAEKFAQYMTSQGWKQIFMLSDGQATPTMLEAESGGSNLFNTVNIGLFITHGSYGTTTEDDYVKYTYLWFPNGSYLKLSAFDFGSPGTNGLAWMTVHACGDLREANFNSMYESDELPINDNLHLLLGSSGLTYMSGRVGLGLAFNMAGVNGKLQQTIPNAWFNAGSTAYQNAGITTAVNSTVVGWPNCFFDSLGTSYSPDSDDSLQYTDQNVFTP